MFQRSGGRLFELESAREEGNRDPGGDKSDEPDREARLARAFVTEREVLIDAGVDVVVARLGEAQLVGPPSLRCGGSAADWTRTYTARLGAAYDGGRNALHQHATFWMHLSKGGSC